MYKPSTGISKFHLNIQGLSFQKKKKVYYKNNMYVKNIHIFIMCVFLYLIMLNTKMILLFEQSQQVQNNDIYKPQVAGHF